MNAPHVLVLDDDKNICAVLTEYLSEAGLSVISANSDREAYEILSGPHQIACLIADVDLGSGTTGFDVSRYARRKDPTIAVIYLSGAASERSFTTFGVPGSEYFIKPFTGSALVSAIQVKIANRRIWGDGGTD